MYVSRIIPILIVGMSSLTLLFIRCFFFFSLPVDVFCAMVTQQPEQRKILTMRLDWVNTGYSSEINMCGSKYGFECN